MRVLMITGSYPPMKCGVGAYTQKLVDALSRIRELQITVLTDARANAAAPAKYYDILPVMKGWGIVELIKILTYIRQTCPDIVHIQSPSMGYPGRIPLILPLLIRISGKPCVQTWHEPVVGWGGGWLVIGLDVLVSVREDLLSKLPYLTQKALYRIPFNWLPSGCMLPAIELDEQKRSDIRRQYTSDDKIILFYYGFVAPLKGLEVLLEIVEKTNTCLLLSCDFQSENSYHRFLLNLIDTKGLKSRIFVLGFLSDEQLARYLVSSDAVVLPFRDGAQDCNTTVEAAAAQGTFVMTTSLEHKGYNKDKNIYYAKPGNVQEMIDAIKHYAGFRKDPQGPVYTWEDIADNHYLLYKQLVSI